jgi:hypothetical protein
MSDADDHRARSAQCFRLAETATSPLQRNAMLNAAMHWMTLANQADRDRAPPRIAGYEPDTRAPRRRLNVAAARLGGLGCSSS